MAVLSATPLSFSAQEVLVVIVGEVILRPAAAAQGRAVGELQQVVQAAGDAAVAVGVVGVEGDGRLAEDAAVQLAAVQDRIHIGIHHAGLRGRVGVDEPAVLVGFVAGTLLIAVAQRDLQLLQGRNGTAAALQLAEALVIGGLDRFFDPVFVVISTCWPAVNAFCKRTENFELTLYQRA